MRMNISIRDMDLGAFNLFDTRRWWTVASAWWSTTGSGHHVGLPIDPRRRS